MMMPNSSKGFQDVIKEIMVNSKKTDTFFVSKLNLVKSDISEEKSS